MAENNSTRYITQVRDTKNPTVFYDLHDPRLTEEIITGIKDWSINDSNSAQYIEGRTHYKLLQLELLNENWDGVFYLGEGQEQDNELSPELTTINLGLKRQATTDDWDENVTFYTDSDCTTEVLNPIEADVTSYYFVEYTSYDVYKITNNIINNTTNFVNDNSFQLFIFDNTQRIGIGNAATLTEICEALGGSFITDRGDISLLYNNETVSLVTKTANNGEIGIKFQYLNVSQDCGDLTKGCYGVKLTISNPTIEDLEIIYPESHEEIDSITYTNAHICKGKDFSKQLEMRFMPSELLDLIESQKFTAEYFADISGIYLPGVSGNDNYIWVNTPVQFNDLPTVQGDSLVKYGDLSNLIVQYVDEAIDNSNIIEQAVASALASQGQGFLGYFKNISSLPSSASTNQFAYVLNYEQIEEVETLPEDEQNINIIYYYNNTYYKYEDNDWVEVTLKDQVVKYIYNGTIWVEDSSIMGEIFTENQWQMINSFNDLTTAINTINEYDSIISDVNAQIQNIVDAFSTEAETY